MIFSSKIKKIIVKCPVCGKSFYTYATDPNYLDLLCSNCYDQDILVTAAYDLNHLVGCKYNSTDY